MPSASSELPESPERISLVFEMISSPLSVAQSSERLEPFVLIEGGMTNGQQMLSFQQSMLEDLSGAVTKSGAQPAFTVKTIVSDSGIFGGVAGISITLSLNALIPPCATSANPTAGATPTAGAPPDPLNVTRASNSTTCGIIRIGC